MTKHALTITATYRIVTPMFCAGADQQTAELRLPSFKGALRFWWRSLMWKKVKDHHELREREAALFGSSEGHFGKSKVEFRWINHPPLDVVRPPAVFESGRLHGAHYLAYGVMEPFESQKKGTKAGELTRPMIRSTQFTVACRCSRTLEKTDRDDVRRSLILLGTLGGLGSKSRKGFGSLTLTDLAIDDAAISLPITPAERLQTLLTDLPDELPAWTAWSSQSRIVATDHASGTRAIEVLDALGREQVHFRSWGRHGHVLGAASEENFRTDHDLSKSICSGSDYPYRVAFGLPHNYGKGVKKQVTPGRHDRRASALFFHIDQIDADSPPHGVVAFLPAEFLAKDDQLKVFGCNVDVATNDAFWFPVHGFLDRLTSVDSPPKARPGYSRFPNDNWWRKQTALEAQEVHIG